MSDMAQLQSQTSAYADFMMQPIREDTIFFLSLNEVGEDNILMRFYDSMAKHPCCQEYSIYWTVYKPDKKIREWCRQREITLVPWEEEEYLRLLATSAYLLSEIKLPIYFSRRQGQSYWNLAVIQDGEARRKKNRPEYEQQVLLWRSSQNFLQSSQILAASDQDIQLLREDYRLENIYDGSIFKIEGIRQQGGQMDLLRDLVLQKDLQSDSVEDVRFTAEKHKVLIQIEWNERDHLREWLPFWLEYVDHEKYDVTLVTGRPKDEVDMYKLTRLPKQVRVMIRRGFTLSGSEQKTQIKEYTQDFWLMSEDEQKNGHLDMQEVYEREWKKIFGCASFDTIVFTSMHPLWYLGTEKKCAHRIFICTREFAKQTAVLQADKYKSEAMKKMDAVFWFGTEELPSAFEHSRLNKLPTPVPMRCLKKDTGQLTTIQYQGREYALLLQGKDWRELHGQIEFIPIPSADQRAYVASGAVKKFLPGFRKLQEKDPDSLLYVFTGDLPDTADDLEEGSKKYVVPIGGVVCGSIPGAFDYFQRFQGCLIHSEDDLDPLASLMGMLEKTIYRVDNGYAEEITIQIDEDRLYRQGKEAVNRIWAS